MAEQELRKKLTKELKCHTLIPGSAFGVFIEDIIALFKQANYVRLADDQSLPENPIGDFIPDIGKGQQWAYSKAQKDMLKPDAKGRVWRKVEL